MTKIDLPYLMRQRDRQGRWAYYVRRKGQRKVRIRGTPGTPGFLAAYQAALGASPPKRAPAARTWRWLCELYFASPEFAGLSKATRDQRQRVLTATWTEPVAPSDDRQMGNVPLSEFNRQAVRVLRDRKAAHPEAANHRVKAIAATFRWAIEVDHFAGPNPARDMPTLRKKNPDGHHTWTLEEVRRYEARHPIGTKARLALAVFAFTGVRISDAAQLGPANVRDGEIVWTEAKGQDRHPKERAIPFLPELQAVLATTKLTGRDTWLVTQYGRPFTVKGLGNWFRDRCDEAGLRHCSAHGLRKAGATIAAENGATDRQLMAIFGWETARQVSTYTRKADRKRLAREAMGLVVNRGE